MFNYLTAVIFIAYPANEKPKLTSTQMLITVNEILFFLS